MNKELLSRVIDQIKADPQSWRQGSWHQHKFSNDCHVEIQKLPECETAHCIAGWTQVLVNKDNGSPWNFCDPMFTERVPAYLSMSAVIETNTMRLPNLYSNEEQEMEIFHISAFAAEQLELSSNQAEYLFNGDRTLEDIVAFLDSDGDVPEGWDDEDYE